ncbi:MAG: IS1 family transposase [Thermodesulfobacteriota bacterium]|nr:IS1 family transposase [Thermodesulfobacteriota bacterium]
MQNPANTALTLFCPRKGCKYYQSTENTIAKDGVYTTKSDSEPRQMFYCHGGKHRFSETGHSDLFGKHGSFKEYEQTAKLSSYGLATDAIADVLQKDRRTIEQWQKAIGQKGHQFHLFLCFTIGLIIRFLQMDELWSYLKNKNQQLWVFIALESTTKFWIGFELGSRTIYTANRLVKGIKELGRWRKNNILKVATDKLAAYKKALENIMSDIPYVYLQIVKRRIKRRLVTVKKYFVKGTAKNFPGKSQNTSFIERLNLTLRQHISYLQRKTLGYCKNKLNFTNVMWINLFNYNYIQFHKSLRLRINNENEKFIKKYNHNTPAMQMGLTNFPLNWRYLITVPIPRK